MIDMSKLRKYKPGDSVNMDWSIHYLKQARDICKRIGAKKTLNKIRSAIKSAEGARRHIDRSKKEYATTMSKRTA